MARQFLIELCGSLFAQRKGGLHPESLDHETILIPLGLKKLKSDPAVASSVFVTTVTDVVGFFGFLGLAALWLKAFGVL